MDDKYILEREIDDMTDRQIVDIITNSDLKGCEEALSIMYKEYYFMVEHFVTSRGGTKEDGKDVFQDAMVVFYNNVKAGKYKVQSKVSTYLFSVSKNIWYNRTRTLKRETDMNEFEYLSLVDDQDIEKELIFSEKQELIGKLLAKSGEKCASLLRYFYFDRFKMKKIAQKLNFASEQEAKNQKHKCMKKLRVLVSNSDNYHKALMAE